jgi:hypothetical protein
LVGGIVNNDCQRKRAAQRRGYRFLTSCLPDSYVFENATAVSDRRYNLP